MTEDDCGRPSPGGGRRSRTSAAWRCVIAPRERDTRSAAVVATLLVVLPGAGSAPRQQLAHQDRLPVLLRSVQ